MNPYLTQSASLGLVLSSFALCPIILIRTLISLNVNIFVSLDWQHNSHSVISSLHPQTWCRILKHKSLSHISLYCLGVLYSKTCSPHSSSYVSKSRWRLLPFSGEDNTLRSWFVPWLNRIPPHPFSPILPRDNMLLFYCLLLKSSILCKPWELLFPDTGSLVLN